MTSRRILGVATVLVAGGIVHAAGCVTPASLPPGKDASVNPEAGGTREGGVCPDPLPAFKPVFRPPSGRRQNRCTDADVFTLVEACLGPQKAPAACADEKAKRAGCTQCMFTEDTSPTWGPVVHLGAFDAVIANWAGCLALLDGRPGPVDGGRTCAESANAYATCPPARCAGCYGTLQAQCNANAYAPESPCKPFEQDLVSCLAKATVPAVDLAGQCGISNPSPEPAEWFRRVALTFCGG
jgi:hypothetical protein